VYLTKEKLFQLEEMIELLIRLNGKLNERLFKLEERISELESTETLIR
jgi:hypothetical protein